MDIRSGRSLDKLEAVLDQMTAERMEYEILFLDAEDEVLIKRYKETRRNHPLSGSGRIEAGSVWNGESWSF